MKDELHCGDYVLATKYYDGGPQDHWVVGFFAGILRKCSGDRYDVSDSVGNLFRGNGFRRVKKVSRKRGIWLLAHKIDIESGAKSLWWWARYPMNKRDKNKKGPN